MFKCPYGNSLKDCKLPDTMLCTAKESNIENCKKEIRAVINKKALFKGNNSQ